MHLLHRLPVFSFPLSPNSFFFPVRPNRRCSMNRNTDSVSAELFPSPSLLTHQERSRKDPKEGKPAGICWRWLTPTPPSLGCGAVSTPPFTPLSLPAVAALPAINTTVMFHNTRHSFTAKNLQGGGGGGVTTGEGSDTRGSVVMRHFFLFVCFSFFYLNSDVVYWLSVCEA